MMLQGDARLAAGKKAEAFAAYQQVIQARSAAGQKPEEELYRRAVQAAYDARLPAASDLARKWVMAYPSPDSWRNSIAVYRNTSKPDLESTMDLFRLMRASGSLNQAADLSESLRIAEKYGVTYIYVGDLERSTYGVQAMEKFSALPVAYDAGGVTIYAAGLGEGGQAAP